jgi:AGCS family alanine or glycine:cation symporter
MMILGMAFPNLLGVMLLSGRLKADLDVYRRRLRAGELPRYDRKARAAEERVTAS